MLTEFISGERFVMRTSAKQGHRQRICAGRSMSKFVVSSLAITEVLLVQPRKFGDHRGFFMETFRRKDFNQFGIDGLRKTVEWYLTNRHWWERIRSNVYRGERLGAGV